MSVMRKIIEINEELCDGCGQCVPSCAEGAIEIIDGKAKLVKDIYCDGLGACMGDCPQGALTLIEREAEEFDEKAVHKFLEKKQKEDKEEAGKKTTLPCGCPSTTLQTFPAANSCEAANKPTALHGNSALTHWPVQIRLIPPEAQFLKGANLLIVADCVSIAYATLHENFIPGKIVMMGCPKFDDAQSYIEKFAEIFAVAAIKSVTVLIMEVPCCSGMPMIVQKGMEKAGITIPIEQVVISTKGEIG